MKVKHCFAALLAAGICMPTLVNAQWYLGVELGETDTELDIGPDFPPSFESTDDDTAWKLFAGFKFNPNFAIEAGYGDLGEYEWKDNSADEKINMQFTAFYATFVGWVPVGDSVKLFGRLGYAYWSADLDYKESGFSSSGDNDDFDPVVGLGFEYQPAKQIGVRFEWEQFQNVGDETSTTLGPGSAKIELNGQDINVVGIGFTYLFEF
jgi:OOP family OmpA-OmpF porin